jgi:hypothetical protein
VSTSAQTFAPGPGSFRLPASAASAVDGPETEMDLDLKRVVALVWLATALVLALGLTREILLPIIGRATLLEDLRHFAFDAEHSLPAWFESLLMAASALLLGLLAVLSRRYDPQNTWHWRVLALVFVLLSMDETVAFHESTMDPLRSTFGFTGLLHFSWVVIAAPLLLAAGLFYLPFLMRLPRPSRTRIVTAGFIFVFGAFGLELIGGYCASTAGMEAVSYKVEATLEECLEIVGLTLFASALLALIAARAPLLMVKLSGRRVHA